MLPKAALRIHEQCLPLAEFAASLISARLGSRRLEHCCKTFVLSIYSLAVAWLQTRDDTRAASATAKLARECLTHKVNPECLLELVICSRDALGRAIQSGVCNGWSDDAYFDVNLLATLDRFFDVVVDSVVDVAEQCETWPPPST